MMKVFKILSLALLTICMSCEEDAILVSCASCQDTRPVDTSIEISLKNNEEDNHNYHLKVFRGKIEDNIVIMELNTRSSVNFTGLVNQEYSALATFTKDGKQYNIVNSTIPEIVDRSDYCERTCYIVKKKEINLRYKYL